MRALGVQLVRLADVRARLGFGETGLMALALLLGCDMGEVRARSMAHYAPPCAGLAAAHHHTLVSPPHTARARLATAWHSWRRDCYATHTCRTTARAPRQGVSGTGAKKATELVQWLVRRAGGGEAAEKDALARVCSLGEGELTAEEEAALLLTGCRGVCRVCGHPCGQRQHGPKGCALCAIKPGCIASPLGALVGTDDCPCAFHRSRHVRLLARARLRAKEDPSFTLYSAHRCRDAFAQLSAQASRDVAEAGRRQTLGRWWHDGPRPTPTAAAVALLNALRRAGVGREAARV